MKWILVLLFAFAGLHFTAGDSQAQCGSRTRVRIFKSDGNQRVRIFQRQRVIFRGRAGC